MRTWSRTVVALAAVNISLALAVPASADQIIRYDGETSAPSFNRVLAYVIKKDNGRRFLTYIAVRSMPVCEDASTMKSREHLAAGRLGEDGAFEKEVFRRTVHLRVDGAIGFRHGGGTWLINVARLTEDGTDAQLCTSGEVTWTVERSNARPLGPSARKRS